MTSRVGKLALVIAAAGGLSVAALSPASVEAGVIHGRPMLAAPTVDSNIVQVVCDRRLSNLWSCNDDVAVLDRRDVRDRDRHAYHPCDHSYEHARDGSRCGNRAADRRIGGR
jgi:hypothetical protein